MKVSFVAVDEHIVFLNGAMISGHNTETLIY